MTRTRNPHAGALAQGQFQQQVVPNKKRRLRRVKRRKREIEFDCD